MPAMLADIARILRETFVAQAEHHPTIGSTSDRAAERARQPPVELPLLVLADQQTAGRGRGANRWWTGPGGLALSLLVDAQTVGARRQRSPLVALAAAVAVADAIRPLLPAHRVGIHWPNDVLAAGRKLAGVLVEVLPDRRHVIGIGLNTNNTLADAPPELQATAATLRDLSGVEQDQTAVLIRLLKCLEGEFSELRVNPAGVTGRANELCLQRGSTLTIATGKGQITGTCAGIDSDGAIVLETPAGVRRFVSGVVRQGRPPPE